MRCVKYLFVISTAALCVGAQAQFVNGDFGTGTLTGWTVANSTNGQSFVQDVQPFDTGLGTSNAAHFQVGQVTFTSGQEAGITLTQNLTLTGGVLYTFGFTWGAQNTNT